MSAYSGPEIANDGLVFAYDIGNTEKSWKGKPTTNFAYTQNARTDNTYATYSATASGTWNAKHSDAIRVYNDLGSEISAYSNTGVADWTNTYHAIWTLDPILQRPVVTMRDIGGGEWLAKSWGTGQTMTSMGLSVGNTYTISWLQWTSNIAKSANVGLYGLNTGGSNGFHDGLSNSFGTSYNTLPNTWQRVYATYTVSSAWNLSAGLSCYMYGMYGGRGTVKVADVQLEIGTPSGFSKAQTRSTTQAIVDQTNNNTVTATSLTYAADNTFSFNGSANYVDCGSGGALTLGNNGSFTASAWVRISTLKNYSGIISKVRSDRGGVYSFMCCVHNDGSLIFYNNASWYASSNAGITTNTWYNVVFSFNGSVMSYYVNGVAYSTSTLTWPETTAHKVFIGSWYSPNTIYDFNGTIAIAQLYNRALPLAEVQQNFNATRGRFGL